MVSKLGIIVRPLVMVLLLIIAYQSILLPENLVNPDAQYIFPTLEHVHSLGDYIGQLLNLRTMDVQPVRDIGFLLDLKVFEASQVNITIIHNLLVWLITGWVINRILKTVFPNLSFTERTLIVMTFLLYPLFTQSVSWGVARKHLLGFLFTLLATDQLLLQKSSYRCKDAALINLYYVLAIFSQPITMLWPLWSLLYVYLSNRSHLKSYLKVFIPSVLIFAGCYFINLYYYSHSPVYAALYATAPKNIFDFGDHILSLGHYVFQLFFPYLLSTTYTLGHWGTLAGLGIAGVVSYLLIKVKTHRSQILIWILFLLIPLAFVILRSPGLWDTYLLIPSFGLLILLLTLKETLPDFRYKNVIYGFCILFFVIFDFRETSFWKSDVELTKVSYDRRPSCLTASQYLKISYENDLPPTSDEARKFLYNNECDRFQLKGKPLINLQAYLLFYESDLPLDQRIEKLENLSRLGILPNIALVALYLKLNQEEKASSAVAVMIERYGSTNYKPEYIPLAKNFVEPFCRKENNQECLRMMSVFNRPAKSLFYK